MVNNKDNRHKANKHVHRKKRALKRLATKAKRRKWDAAFSIAA